MNAGRHGLEQLPYQPVKLGILNYPRRRFTQQGSTQHPRQAQNRAAAAGITIRSAVFAQDFALYAEHSLLQGKKMDVVSSESFGQSFSSRRKANG
jgi:hypothetical protein